MSDYSPLKVPVSRKQCMALLESFWSFGLNGLRDYKYPDCLERDDAKAEEIMHMIATEEHYCDTCDWFQPEGLLGEKSCTHPNQIHGSSDNGCADWYPIEEPMSSPLE